MLPSYIFVNLYTLNGFELSSQLISWYCNVNPFELTNKYDLEDETFHQVLHTIFGISIVFKWMHSFLIYFTIIFSGWDNSNIGNYNPFIQKICKLLYNETKSIQAQKKKKKKKFLDRLCRLQYLPQTHTHTCVWKQIQNDFNWSMISLSSSYYWWLNYCTFVINVSCLYYVIFACILSLSNSLSRLLSQSH